MADLDALRNAYRPNALHQEWTEHHSRIYPQMAAKIINTVRELLLSAAPAAPTGQPAERFDLSHTAGFYQAMDERPLLDAEQAWLYRNALQKIGEFDDGANKAAIARAAISKGERCMSTEQEIFELAHMWAQECYRKGLGKDCDIDGRRAGFSAALRAALASAAAPATPENNRWWFEQGKKVASTPQAAPTSDALAQLRADGWRVAVHNDYMQDGALHTFWLFTKGERAIKGEGLTDAEALAQAIARAQDRESGK